jgi:hypothetical protein
MSDMSEHRVPMLGTSWRRFEDPVRSRDPRIRSLVAALATLPAPAPRPEFRAELRAQLVAIAPRIVAESSEPTAVLPKVGAPTAEAAGAAPHAARRRPRHTDSAFARLRAIPLARPLRIVTAVVAAFALLLGGAVWMSRKALPGDTLYGLKRASEQVQLQFAGSDTAKAKDLLHFASVRADEVQDLLARDGVSGGGASGLNAGTANLIASTLASADSDVRSASDILTTQALEQRSPGTLNVLTKWAPGQISRLQGIAAAVPDPSLRNRTESSAHLVDAAVARAEQLAPKIVAGCAAATAPADSLGPLPQAVCSTTPTSIPPVLGTTSGTPRSASATHSGGVSGSGGGSIVSVQPATSGANGVQPTGSETTKGGGILPPILPSTTPSLPVGVSSCGVNASLGPIGIGIGLCSGVHLSVHP